MDIKKCINGHFFDVDTYSLCPHCGSEVMQDDRDTGHSEKKAKWFGKKDSKSKEQVVAERHETESIYSQAENERYDRGNYVQEKPPVRAQNANNNSLFDDNRFEDNSPQKNNEPKVKSGITIDYWNTTDYSTEGAINYKKENENAEKREKPTEPVPEIQQPTSNANIAPVSVKEAVEKASAAESGKTLSFFSLNKTDSTPVQQSTGSIEIATSSAASETPAGSNMQPQPAEPPVGWLVCIKGPHLGQCFYIYSGRNSIGRNPGNRILINLDGHVSREKHAWISYEPKKRKFNLQPGDGTGLTYLNDENILGPQEVKQGDKIEVGNTILLFVPLCGPDFSWEDYLKEN